jgi:hypothetical protein
LHSFGVWSVPVRRSVEDPRGVRHLGRVFAPHTCIRSVRLDRDHDAVMRIGGEAPGGGPILSVLPRSSSLLSGIEMYFSSSVFGADSPLEGDGFEPSVPLRDLRDLAGSSRLPPIIGRRVQRYLCAPSQKRSTSSHSISVCPVVPSSPARGAKYDGITSSCCRKLA